jgi:putative membrane protein
LQNNKYVMIKIITKLTLNVLTLLIVAYIIPGFDFESVVAVIVAAIVMGAVNTFIKPVLQIIFIPLTIVTFGITAFLINVVLLWMVSFIVPGFTIQNFLTAVIASIAMVLISMFLNKLGEEKI